MVVLTTAEFKVRLLTYPLDPRPVTVLGRKTTALLVYVFPTWIAVDKRLAVNVLMETGRFGTPMVLRLTFGLKNVTTPLVNDVKIYPVEKGELLDISYAKILRKAIESVSYVFLELVLIYFEIGNEITQRAHHSCIVA